MLDPLVKLAIEANEITPEVAARAFWAMCDSEQAQFFVELAKAVYNTPNAYSYGEMQWLFMRDEIRKIPEANNMYMALSAWAYDFWPQKAEL